MRHWLSVATGCGCETLDVCALFEAGGIAPDVPPANGDVALAITEVGA
jgi:hypothetical protein